MKYTTSEVSGTVEILASKDFQGIPVTIAGDEIVKAGTPIKADGTAVPAGTGAAGILLYDVNPAENPNATIVVSGIVDWTKCKAHSGATATVETMKTALPAITFRENIGVTDAG